MFEGYRFNTQDKLRENQLNYSLKIPMAHDAGNPDTDEIPQTMSKYNSGGTPWTVIIDPAGRVVYNAFHIKPAHALEMIELLTTK